MSVKKIIPSTEFIFSLLSFSTSHYLLENIIAEVLLELRASLLACDHADSFNSSTRLLKFDPAATSVV